MAVFVAIKLWYCPISSPCSRVFWCRHLGSSPDHIPWVRTTRCPAARTWARRSDTRPCARGHRCPPDTSPSSSSHRRKFVSPLCERWNSSGSRIGTVLDSPRRDLLFEECRLVDLGWKMKRFFRFRCYKTFL